MKKILLPLIILCSIYISCSKSASEPTPTDPCNGVNISVTGTVTQTSSSTATNGGINATASGASGFTYSLNNGAFQASGNFTGLANGSYSITAKSSAGCIGAANFTVASVPCPTITVSGTVTATSSATATNGAIAANATGSTGLTFSINGAAFQTSGNFTGLAVGSYTIVARDANGCSGQAIFTISAAACPTINVSNTNTPASGPTTSNGSITASASGGIAPYTYSINAGAFQASGTFSNLMAGNYSIVAKDANGCLSAASAVTLGTNCPTINATSVTTTTVKCENNTGSVTINASGSIGFMYSLNGGTFQASNVFSALAVASYNYTVRDMNGCTAAGTASVTQAPAGSFFTQVKAILAANCVSCHGGANPTAGINFTDDCTIVSKAARIKARAVDFNPSTMPPSGGPISSANRQTIVDWINAGGKHNN
jgi:mono/diheme cytochrome c family protein